jgi:hypothetical protein
MHVQITVEFIAKFKTFLRNFTFLDTTNMLRVGNATFLLAHRNRCSQRLSLQCARIMRCRSTMQENLVLCCDPNSYKREANF